MAGDLSRRLSVAALGVPATVAVTVAGGWVFASGLGLLAAVGTWEIGRMFASRGEPYWRVLAAAFGAALPVSVLAGGWAGAWMVTVVFVLLIGAYSTLRLHPSRGPFRTSALTSMAALYVGGLLSTGVPLREGLAGGRLEGTLLFFLPVAVTWLSDTAAYAVGKTIGRRPLAPVVSPNKTVEGGVAAIAAGPVGALVYGGLLVPDLWERLGPPGLLFLGAAIAGAAMMGDLVESALKRECGVKDSSGLLPGHGGLLDRMDSLLWSIPVTYFVLYAVGGG